VPFLKGARAKVPPDPIFICQLNYQNTVLFFLWIKRFQHWVENIFWPFQVMGVASSRRIPTSTSTSMNLSAELFSLVPVLPKESSLQVSSTVLAQKPELRSERRSREVNETSNHSLLVHNSTLLCIVELCNRTTQLWLILLLSVSFFLSCIFIKCYLSQGKNEKQVQYWQHTQKLQIKHNYSKKMLFQ